MIMLIIKGGEVKREPDVVSEMKRISLKNL